MIHRLMHRFVLWDTQHLMRVEARRGPIRRRLHDAWQAVVFTVFGFFLGGGR